ncbi:MAG: DUF2225 domain-containing protein [Lachnospiraceae bacterium]|jgi:hypothetical protein|nr:DUF2225 domain-containing protein [Lachnospiraceae bacterium]
MNLLSGLEKFGLSADGTMNLFEDEKTKAKPAGDGEGASQAAAEPTEADFLLDKHVRCQICEKTFAIKAVKNGRVKRLEPDKDLRPRHQYIDTLKYSVISCPHCGYTALSRSVGDLTSVQRKLIQENICAKFKPAPVEEMENYSYDYALEHFKLALFNSVAKKGKASEKAYICLCISWLLRGKAEEMEADKEHNDDAGIAAVRQEEKAYYDQAYEGFMKAVSSEQFPMVGMDQSTVDFLLASMSYQMGKLDVASKLIGSIITSPAANSRMKDKARDLKEEIINAIKTGKK